MDKSILNNLIKESLKAVLKKDNTPKETRELIKQALVKINPTDKANISSFESDEGFFPAEAEVFFNLPPRLPVDENFNFSECMKNLNYSEECKRLERKNDFIYGGETEPYIPLLSSVTYREENGEVVEVSPADPVDFSFTVQNTAATADDGKAAASFEEIKNISEKLKATVQPPPPKAA